MKTCTKCGETKELDLFYKQSAKKDGLHPWCKACCKENDKTRKEYFAEYRSERTEEQVESHLQSTRVWKAKNRGPVKEYNRQYQLGNRDKISMLCSRRRAKLKSAQPAWLTDEHHKEIEQFYWLAQDLKKVTGEEYQVDHIIPLQNANVCGLHVPWNLQVLPRDVNQMKFNKLEW